MKRFERKNCTSEVLSKDLGMQAKFEFVHKYEMQMVSDTLYFASIVKETMTDF